LGKGENLPGEVENHRRGGKGNRRKNGKSGTIIQLEIKGIKSETEAVVLGKGRRKGRFKETAFKREEMGVP